MSEAKAKLKSGGKRFSKFSLVGLSNAAIDIGVLNLFLWLEPTREVTLLVHLQRRRTRSGEPRTATVEHAVDLQGKGRARHEADSPLRAAGTRQHRDKQRAVLGTDAPRHRLHRGAHLSRRQRRQDHLRNRGFDHQLFHHALRGFLAQALVQRAACKSPWARAKLGPKCGSSSVGRASPCHGEGRGFESRLPLWPRFASGAAGGMAEWLGKGLQNPVPRFDSGCRLSEGRRRPTVTKGD